MEKEIKELDEELITNLQLIEVSADNVLQKAERSCRYIKGLLTRLRSFVLDYTFKSEDEEILFFKEIKPRFVRELIFYHELYLLEAGRPVGNIEAEHNYLIREQQRVQMFFERHRELYNYHRLGSTDKDWLYFLRSTDHLPQDSECSLDFDPVFSTIYSTRISKVLAYEQFSNYLARTLARADQSAGGEPSPLKTLQWTETKVGLIELGYAIYAARVLDNGKADIKQIMTLLEIMFNVDLGNYYSAFLKNIRLRKKEPVILIKKLEHSLSDYINELIEHPKYS